MKTSPLQTLTRTLALGLLFWMPLAGAAESTPAAMPAAAPIQATAKAASHSTADHSKFEVLKKPFASGPEVTKACLSCHTEAAKQVQKTKHWTWEFMNPETQQRLGKKHVINNFCTACHVGYGWKDNNFDFAAQENVDCLVCHDTTGTYRKLPGLAGHPNYQDMEYPPHSGKIVKAPDLGAVARGVGKSSRANCGACHFYGGGGDAVKHGDLDSSMKNPAKYLDVHMAKDGLNFTCGTCHATAGHDVPGSRYAPTASDEKHGSHMRGKKDANPATCQACHGTRPHSVKFAKLNDHTDKIACQTCHIPEFARGGVPTKMSWDWSTAGKLDKEGKPFKLKDSGGHDAYDSKKGDFKYEDNVIPEYIWFNGKVNYTLRETKLDPTQIIRINHFEGSPDDGKSKIWPIKRFTGKQPYDMVTNTLLIPHTYGKDDSSFWSNFNWDKALATGMQAAGGTFSGKFGFVATEMSWPITHMVAPKTDALTCQQCHGENGRLDKVPGLYMPGRDANPWLDKIGWGIVLLTLLGVVAHGGLRIVMAGKGEQQ